MDIKGFKFIILFDENVVGLLKVGVSWVIMMGVGEGLVKIDEFFVVEDGILVKR